ncbi:MAG: selenocysteine lyase [Bacteroidetes bacterium GWE2_42_24]|nr:MAG: selenocysteine lyase [Bacteroidetes bacterium GWE2_42_24]OFY25405.1 MAG: selenocysteine lyase [Bacteroidetes bacterium GWF2_43_11]
MEHYFESYRQNTIGHHLRFQSPYGEKQLIYADWIASGRLYQPIEEKVCNEIGPWVANTHTETSETGTMMTKAYHLAQKLIKQHVNAGPKDVLITNGFGMTSVINKLQRILGLKFCGRLFNGNCLGTSDRPVVFITHMEHHSNHTSWLETIAEVVIVGHTPELLVDLNDLRAKLHEYRDRHLKIGSFTACSNVTGIITPYHQLARVMHENGGICFIDFAASAPYVDINMHPADPMEKLDAIFFSPHKFLGGPGTSGIMVFDSALYHNRVPDQPGGGTVDWTNPWGEYKFIDDIEAREDGGTPGFLQAMRCALTIDLKNSMGTDNIHRREQQLVKKGLYGLRAVPNLHILADNIENRLGIISFYLEGLHYNLVVKLLNDLFGIQVRGGCACAGTYGHILLDVSYEKSKRITEKINFGDLSEKPGWIRLSLHPTMTDAELDTVFEALHYISANYKKLEVDYVYNKHKNEFRHKLEPDDKTDRVTSWFSLAR